VEPERFVKAVAAGADLIEIGNFDSFYAQGRRFEAEEVLALTHQTRPARYYFICYRSPTLELDRQVQLAEELVKAGADIKLKEEPAAPGSCWNAGLIERQPYSGSCL